MPEPSEVIADVLLVMMLFVATTLVNVPLKFSSTRLRSASTDMQKAPPPLPSPISASIHFSSSARLARPRSAGE